MGRELKSNDCLARCDWHATDEVDEGLRIFACSACQTEWTTEQVWTPRNWDGKIAPEVAEAKAAAGK